MPVIQVEFGDVSVQKSHAFGRAAQLSQLRRALRTTLAGTGGCVIVEGPAGIGKSRILAAARDLASERAAASIWSPGGSPARPATKGRAVRIAVSPVDSGIGVAGRHDDRAQW